MNEREILIWLNLIWVNSANIFSIYQDYEDLEKFWSATDSEILDIKYLTKGVKSRIVKEKKSFNKSEFDELTSKYDIITYLDNNYPEKLKNIPNPPMVLYTKGLPLNTNNITIGMVGSRKYTDYGKWIASKFSRELSELNVAIISGLALGIDGFSHLGAMESGGYTIGVLGCGIDVVYPRTNKEIFKKMEKYGTIVSEYPPETEPIPRNFPVRNRIISGLSDGLIVVEAKEKSGTLITVSHALEQGKTIFSVPGNINSIFSSGTNKLIKDGAIPLLDIGDILDEFPKLKNDIQESKIDNNINISDTEKLILKTIKEGPIHIDEMVYKLSIDVSSLMTLLIGLELKGLIEEISSNTYTITTEVYG